jgi:hypothetical protein
MREREPRGHDTHKKVVHERQHSAVQRRREEEAPDAGQSSKNRTPNKAACIVSRRKRKPKLALSQKI